MANINSGTVVRFENGGILLIGADILLNLVSGSLEWNIPGYEPVMTKDRGVIQDPIPGDERPCSGKLSIRYTGNHYTSEIGAAIMGALVSTKVKNVVSASGLLFTFPMTVKVPDFLGATVGDQYVFAKCFLENGLEYKTGSGTDTDTLDLSFMDAEASPAITRYA